MPKDFPTPPAFASPWPKRGVTDQAKFVAIDVMGGEHRTEAHGKKNPDATVPCLELDNRTHIAECNAVIEYINATFYGPTLTGTTPKERAHISMMDARAEADLLTAVGAYFHHATPGLGEALETYQCAEWGSKQKEVAAATMAYLDGVLADNDYVAGDSFSAADITTVAGLAFADLAKVEIPQSHENLQAWHSRLANRPSISG